MTTTEELFSSDFPMLVHKYGEDAAMDAFEALLKMEHRGSPITRSLLWTITQRKAVDTYRDSRRERHTADRVGNSNSLMREQQTLFAPTDTDMRGRDDDPEIVGLRPGEQMGYPFNSIGERTWS